MIHLSLPRVKKMSDFITENIKGPRGLFLNSLEKVFPDEKCRYSGITSASVLIGERYSLQFAFTSGDSDCTDNLNLKVSSPLKEYTDVKLVDYVPARLVRWDDSDDRILRKTAGLFPDILCEYPEHGIKLLENQWRSLWITVSPGESVAAGEYPLKISLFKFDDEDNPLIERTFIIEVLGIVLPKPDFVCTRWIHYDCIADYYHCKVFSAEFWEITESYIETAVKYGVNTILTPVFTPPLDTQKGKERTTVQLVGVKKKNGKYYFNFNKLTAFIRMCDRHGIKYFEFSHIFTQWGAEHAPKIIVETENGPIKEFGWHTKADSDEYLYFLDCFFSALSVYLEKHALKERAFFHISDEPGSDCIERYKKGAEIIRRNIRQAKIIDATSDPEIYNICTPYAAIPSLDCAELFTRREIENVWTYYCTSQYKQVSNQFLNMPSSRNRIIGLQFYKYGISGFLHWGFNFWNSFLSLKQIDPYAVSDGGGYFLAGDPFTVYPGDKCAVPSVRLTVFYEALQDLSSLIMLEAKIGRAAVIEIIEAGLEHPITFNDYPCSSEWLIALRQRINRKIAEEYQ